MKEAAAALPFPMGKGAEGGFFLLVEEMRERVRVWGWEEALYHQLESGSLASGPSSSPAALLLL